MGAKCANSFYSKSHGFVAKVFKDCGLSSNGRQKCEKYFPKMHLACDKGVFNCIYLTLTRIISTNTFKEFCKKSIDGKVLGSAVNICEFCFVILTSEP